MRNLTEISEFLEKMTRIVTVAGKNPNAVDELAALLPQGAFDEISADRAGNIILTRKAARTGLPHICIDAHFDQIGMLVRSIEADGFVGVINAGGLDARTLPAQQVVIHGREQVRGVIVSTPPHLRRASDGDALTPIEELLVDTGYSEEELLERVSPGDPISFEYKCGRLANDRFFSPGLDNKSTATAAILAALESEREDMACDLSILLAAAEELGGFSGARVGLDHIRPDAVIVLDVEFADCAGATHPGLPVIGEGPVITHSALCDRHLVSHVVSLAVQKDIPHSVMAWGSSLGTDGDVASTCAEGISVASISLPLTSMHTCVESVSLRDVDSLARLLTAVICDRELLEHTVVGLESSEEVGR